MYKTIILPVFFLYGCETLSHAKREKHRLRVSENRPLRRIFGPKRDEAREELSFTIRRFIFYTHPQISLGRPNQTECGRRGMWHVWRREESIRGFVGKAENKATIWKTEAKMGEWV
jgi:hypothetical protein